MNAKRLRPLLPAVLAVALMPGPAAAGSAAAAEFRAGQPVVVALDGSYYRGTVEKVSREGGCTRVDYRFGTGHVYGSGHTYPGCTRAQDIYTLEEARQRNLKIVGGDGPSAAPPPSGAPAQEQTAAAEAGQPRPAQGDSVSAAQRQQLLQAHNRWREQVGVPPLEWSQRVADSAQAWAGHLAKIVKLEHDPDTKYGENLFIGSGDRSAAEAVEGWGHEKAMCNYRNEPISRKPRCPVGHYTQMVWRSSKELGCGVARTAGRRSGTVWVCRYDPPGNFLGQKPY